jgi:hypothetical protein
MPRLTEGKKEKIVDRLYSLKDRVNKIVGELYEMGITDEEIDYLSNMTCNFDEAVAEVQNLEVGE